MSPVEKLLCELIALPSVNPAFLSPNHPHAGENRVSHFLTATAAKAGLDIDFRDALPGRPNLIIRLAPRGATKRRILLAPHLDTVNGNEDQFQPKRINGRMYGRGACDTKGCIASMLTALIEISKDKNRPAETELMFVGLMDEECGQGGSRAFAGGDIKADLAIVGEPTQLQLVTAHKGSLWLRFETQGKSAHGSRPELGKNAVHEMARVVNFLETKYAAQLRRRKHPLLRHGTISVGSIEGGTQPNIVPDHCLMTADRRLLPGETEASVRREINELLRKEGLQAALQESKKHAGLPLETDVKLPLVRQFMSLLKQEKPVGVDYFCDASVLAHGGIPSVVFGPGDIAQAHTVDEWISLKSLERGTSILVKFLKSLP